MIIIYIFPNHLMTCPEMTRAAFCTPTSSADGCGLTDNEQLIVTGSGHLTYDMDIKCSSLYRPALSFCVSSC